MAIALISIPATIVLAVALFTFNALVPETYASLLRFADWIWQGSLDALNNSGDTIPGARKLANLARQGFSGHHYVIMALCSSLAAFVVNAFFLFGKHSKEHSPRTRIEVAEKAADKQKHDELAKLSGADFDREFAKAMVKGHEEAISKFEAASKGDDDIAKFAQETLPTLQKHLKAAQTFESSKRAQGEPPAASEATKPKSEMAPSGAAQTEAAPSAETKKEASETKNAEMAAVPSDAVGVNDYYKQNVYDTSNNTVGEVSDLLLDKSGRVKAVILSVGGFLGLGGKCVSVPFNALQATEKNGKRYLVMDTTTEALTSAPVINMTTQQKSGCQMKA